MKKTLITLAAATVLTLSISSSALAAQGVVEKGVNFRTSPSTSGSVIGLVKAGTTFEVLDQVNSYWVKANVNGQVGYLSTNYVKIDSSSPGNAAAGQGVVEKGVNFRTGPSTSSSVIGLVKAGTTFQIVEKVNSYWVKANINGQIGYLSTDYVSLGATAPSNPAPAPTPTPAPPEQASNIADRVIHHANNLIGVTKYKYGSNLPPTLLDCSSFTKFVFGIEGVNLKWGTKYQKDAGTAVSRSNLQKGDLIFFWTSSSGVIDHVGIYIGDGKIIHNTPSMNGVGISSITSGYWDTHYVSARRVL
ncbi:SH3 domain-containing protein [Paenibacillus mesotrionivorans]|uniref:SH3 domain-containing protein n=1 Tax=Paenibacillus mesotrionivorans TaxID=3160968 RepID=A0ACC7P1Y1_9BACL